MKMRSLRVCFRQGLQGIWRNRLMVIASVCTVSACLFILGIVYCLVANVRQFADDLDDSLGIIAFLSEDVSDDGVTSLVSQIEGMDGVKEVIYVSAEEAWQSFKDSMGFDEQLGQDTITRLDRDNPLSNSASLQIYPKNPLRVGDGGGAGEPERYDYLGRNGAHSASGIYRGTSDFQYDQAVRVCEADGDWNHEIHRSQGFFC